MAAEGIKRTFILDGLRDALQTLAAPGDVALALVPDGTVKADELALDFDNVGRAALESLESELTQAQRENLVAVTVARGESGASEGGPLNRSPDNHLLRDYLPGSKRSRHSYGLTRFSGFHTKYRLRSKGFVKLTGSVVVRM